MSVLNRLRHHIRLIDESELSLYERTARKSSLRTALACQEVFGTPVSETIRRTERLRGARCARAKGEAAHPYPSRLLL